MVLSANPSLPGLAPRVRVRVIGETRDDQPPNQRENAEGDAPAFGNEIGDDGTRIEGAALKIP